MAGQERTAMLEIAYRRKEEREAKSKRCQQKTANAEPGEGAPYLHTEPHSPRCGGSLAPMPPPQISESKTSKPQHPLTITHPETVDHRTLTGHEPTVIAAGLSRLWLSGRACYFLADDLPAAVLAVELFLADDFVDAVFALVGFAAAVRISVSFLR